MHLVASDVMHHTHHLEQRKHNDCCEKQCRHPVHIQRRIMYLDFI